MFSALIYNGWRHSGMYRTLKQCSLGNKILLKWLRCGRRQHHVDANHFEGKTIYHNLTKLASVIILLLCLNVVSGCSDPETDAAQYAAQAEILLDQNRFAEARQTISRAIAARDDVAEYHILRGRIEYTAGSFENAYSAYSEALALAPSNQEALQAVSQLGLRVGRLSESVDATDKLLILNPTLTDARLIRGLHALIKRDYTAATKTADEILAIDPLNEGGVVLKARSSFMSGNPQEAAQILDVFDSSRPNTIAVSLTRLEIYRALRNAAMMAKQFTALSPLRPDDLDLRLDHANFLYKTSASVQATKLVSSVLADKTATPKQVGSAILLWQEYSVVKVDPTLIRKIAETGSATARIASARYFADMGNIAAASSILTAMTGADADAERAKIALAQGDKSRAQSLITDILDGDKTHCSALKTQAMMWFADRRYSDALVPAQSASSECPDQPRLWQLTAKIYAAMDDEVNARRVFAQGIDANKQSEVLSRGFAEYLLAQNSTREAIAVARKLTRAAPALNSGWRLYADICAKAPSSCIDEAKQGLMDAQTRYGVDLLPGELPPNGLFGRLIVR